MFLSAVSVLVVVQPSSEVPEGLMNNPVLFSEIFFSGRPLLQAWLPYRNYNGIKVCKAKFCPWPSAYAEQYRQEDPRTVDDPHGFKTQNPTVKGSHLQVIDKAKFSGNFLLPDQVTLITSRIKYYSIESFLRSIQCLKPDCRTEIVML
jgi:hypothetical protein